MQHYNFASVRANSITWITNYQLETDILGVSRYFPFCFPNYSSLSHPSWIYQCYLITGIEVCFSSLVRKAFSEAAAVWICLSGADAVSVGRDTEHRTREAITQLLLCYLELEGLEPSAPTVISLVIAFLYQIARPSQRYSICLRRRSDSVRRINLSLDQSSSCM